MKLIQTPSLITGVILGASLITLSAAGNNAAPGDLNVFVPGTVVSSADVNANFTYLDDEVTTLEGRVGNLEGSSSAPEVLHYQWPTLSYVPTPDNLSLTVPEGFAYRILDGYTLYSEYSNGIKSFNDPQSGWGCHLLVEGLSSITLEGPISTYLAGNLTDGEYPRKAITFTPGTTITFQANNSSVYYEGIFVAIEKIPFSPITPGQ